LKKWLCHRLVEPLLALEIARAILRLSAAPIADPAIRADGGANAQAAG
jgi:hypothetical protein